ncbi:MAG TPA: glycosyltransferase family 4 protein [Candidatus Thermoplasmatota archaeon]|nr:glycosyltransferase family 4 protein [Candidatus Thermoplasmatota archaeon]
MPPLDVGVLFGSIKNRFGGERLTLQTVEQLARHVDVTFYTPGIASGLEPTGAATVTLGRLRKSHSKQTISDWLAMPPLARRTKHHDVFLALGTQAALGGALAGRRHKVPYVYECLEPPRIFYDLKGAVPQRVPGLNLAGPVIKRLDRWAVGRAAHIISISEWTQAQVKAIYGRDSTVIYPGIDTAAILAVDSAAARRKLGLTNETVYLSVSKLHARKRIDRIIEVFAERAAADLTARLYIAGLGPEEQSLKALAAASPVADRIRFLGYVSDEERLAWLRASQVFLFMAIDEPFGIAPLEAKIAGCEVLPNAPPYPVPSLEESARQVLKVLNAEAER